MYKYTYTESQVNRVREIKMDNMLLEELSKAIGVKLTVRDNKQLEHDTLDMQFEKLCKKQQAARQTVVSEIDEEAAMQKSGRLD